MNPLTNIINFFLKKNKEYNKINITIPNHFMNCSITIDNNFIADTNNSKDWYVLKFPLPKPSYNWNIHKYNNNNNHKIVVLIDKPYIEIIPNNNRNNYKNLI